MHSNQKHIVCTFYIFGKTMRILKERKEHEYESHILYQQLCLSGRRVLHLRAHSIQRTARQRNGLHPLYPETRRYAKHASNASFRFFTGMRASPSGGSIDAPSRAGTKQASNPNRLISERR